MDLEKHKENMRACQEAYIEAVQDTPAMNTTIKLVRGVEKSKFLDRRADLLVFLKGSKKAKEELKERKPDMFKYFESIWKLRRDHLVDSMLPQKYAFILHCCGKKGCIHPRCAKGFTAKQWYTGGPTVLTHLPLPMRSKEECVTCKGICAGHYKKDIEASNSPDVEVVPSVYFAGEFAANEKADAQRIIKMSKVCMLKAQEVKFFWEHMVKVKRNRLRGVEKAKKTRAAKETRAAKKK